MGDIVSANKIEGSSKVRAVAYIRVSSEEQVHGTSLDSQKKAVQEYAKNQGWVLDKADIYREEGVSAKIIDRPQLAAMLDHIAKNKGKYQFCIVWKVDRLARKSEYHHIIKSQLAKYGVKLVSVTEPIDEGPTGTLMESMLAAFAQFDNEIRTLRSTMGMRARTEQGGWSHPAPYGYRAYRTPSGVGSLTPDEVEAPIMTTLLEKFATGDFTIKQLAALSYDLGIRNRRGEARGWQAVENMVINPIYAGFIRTKFTDGRYIKGLHPALISERTHFRILAIVNGDIKKYSKHAELDWPLRGGFIRHTCAKAMTGSAPVGRSGPSPRYHCTVCKAEPGKRVSKRRELIHDDFLALMQRIKPEASIAQLFKEIVLKRWNEEYKFAIEHNAKLDAEIKAAQEKETRIIDLFVEGRLTDTEKSTRIADVQKGIAQLKLQRIEADKYLNQKVEIIDAALLFMSDAGLFWNLCDIEVKKRIQDVIFPEGIEYDFETGFRTPKLAESYLLIKKIAGEPAINSILAPGTGFEPAT